MNRDERNEYVAEIKELYLEVLNEKKQLIEMIEKYAVESKYEVDADELLHQEYLEKFEQSLCSTYSIEESIFTDLYIYEQQSSKSISAEYYKILYDEELVEKIKYCLDQYLLNLKEEKIFEYLIPAKTFQLKLLEEKEYFVKLKKEIMRDAIENFSEIVRPDYSIKYAHLNQLNSVLN